MCKGTLALRGIYCRVSSIDTQSQLSVGCKVIRKKSNLNKTYRIVGIVVVRNQNGLDLVYRCQPTLTRVEIFIPYTDMKANYWQLY